MKTAQTAVHSGSTTLKNCIGSANMEYGGDIFKPESRITIDGKTYLIQRYFVNKRCFTDAIFTAIKNDAKRILLDASKNY